MSLVARAALMDATSWVKLGAILDLDFVNGRYFWKGLNRSPSELTYSGGANATFHDSGGTLRAGITNVMRIDYNPNNGAPRGYWAEPARTNLALWSDDFTQALTWIAVNMTVAMTATGPDGVANSATTLTAAAANATILQTLVSGSATRVSSVYIKRRTGTGTINVTQDNGTTWTVVTVTSAWTRVQIPAATAANPIIGIRVVTDTDAVDVYGFQHETAAGGVAGVSSLARTTTASVAKTADSLSILCSTFGLVSQTGITVYCELIAPSAIQGGYGFELSLAAGDNQEELHVVSNAGAPEFFVYSASAQVVSNTGATNFVADTAAKIAAAIELNNARHAMNGTLQNSDDAACVVPAPDTLYIGRARTISNNGCHVKRIAVWNKRLQNETLQQLTV